MKTSHSPLNDTRSQRSSTISRLRAYSLPQRLKSSMVIVIGLLAHISTAVAVPAPLPPLSEDELYESADVAVHAEVTEIVCVTYRRDNISGNVTYGYEATLSVDELIKGDTGDELTIAFTIIERPPAEPSDEPGESCADSAMPSSDYYHVGQKGDYYLRYEEDLEDYRWVDWSGFVADEDSSSLADNPRAECIQEMRQREVTNENLDEESEDESTGDESTGDESTGDDMEQGGCDARSARTSEPAWLILILSSFLALRRREGDA